MAKKIVIGASTPVISQGLWLLLCSSSGPGNWLTQRPDSLPGLKHLLSDPSQNSLPTASKP